MIDKLVKLWPRGAGNGWYIPKIHAQFHVPRNIGRIGNQLNVHSGPQEANHIVLHKGPSQNAQRRKAVIDLQTAKRLSEWLIIKKAHHLMNQSSHAEPQIISPTHYATKGKIVLYHKHGSSDLKSAVKWNNKQKYRGMSLPHIDEIYKLLINRYWA
jgi:hypothetical protein